MQKLTFRNSRGHETVFQLADPYVFWEISGLSLPPVETIYTQSAGQSGYTLHSIMLESRRISLKGHVIGTGGDVRKMYAERQKLMQVCNPMLGLGTLFYENDSGKWSLPAFCTSAPYAMKVHYVQTLTLEFECPSPYWRDEHYTNVGLAYVDGGLQFPLETPGFFGTLGYRAIVDNRGDIDAPVELLMDGGAINPTITNKTTGEFITVRQQTGNYDKLYINTDPEELAVEIIRTDGIEEFRENAYGFLSYDSTLFKLAPGVNELLFTSDEENKRVHINIKYKSLYVGV